MNSLRWRVAVWFAASLLAVLAVFVGVTHLHLHHELRAERWERAAGGHGDRPLHGNYSEAEVDDITAELWRLSLLYALPVAAMALGIGFLVARRSFRPVAEMNRQLQAIGARSLAQRVHLTQADREFQAIEANINALLERLDGSFRQLTEYSAQVAHELRTPLTLLRLQVEDAAGRIEPALAETLQDELRRLSDYVDQALLLATAEQGRLALQREPVALAPLVRDLLEAYERLAREEGRAIVCGPLAAATVRTDDRYVRQMLHNLLTNALRYGVGPVRLSLSEERDAIVCRVENERAPDAGGRHGHGLGLRVTQALATALGCAFRTEERDREFVAELGWPR